MAKAGFKVTRIQTDIIYGPVDSRRYGVSVGLNVLPRRYKVCTFDCVYCQLGFTKEKVHASAGGGEDFPPVEQYGAELEEALRTLSREGVQVQSLTFSGNGEPTLHPQFDGIARVTAELRDRHCPQARTVLLSNATTLEAPRVQRALRWIDEPVLKLDAGDQQTLEAINGPYEGLSIDRLVEGIKALPGVTIQAMFISGLVDNAGEEAVGCWIDRLREIKPRAVQIYSLDRSPADKRVRPVPGARLEAIAQRVRDEVGAQVEVY